MSTHTVVLFWSFVLLLLASCTFASDFYSFTVKDIRGNDVSMGKFKGKVLLIVNVASECGYTDINYKQLVQLKNLIGLITKNFEILAFPCNQFGQQEPKTNIAIEKFARNRYGVNFPMFSKVKVVGELAHPLYRYLQDKIGRAPEWNFAKYLVDGDGMVVRFWAQDVTPMSLVYDIQRVLSPGTEEYFTKDVKEEL